MKKILILILSLSLVMTMLYGCNTSVLDTSISDNLEKDYKGVAKGYDGDLNVGVTLDSEGKILAIDVDKNHNETEGIGTKPIEVFPDKIISSQSLDIESITGATITGNALLAAIANAIENAGLNPSDYGYIEKQKNEEIMSKLDLTSMPDKEPKTGSITITDAKGREVKLDIPISTYAISTMDVIDFIIPLLGEDAFHKLVGSGQDGGGGIQGYSKLYTPIVGDYTKHMGQISDHNAPFDLEMILATNPDVLIVNSAMGAHRYALEVESQLETAGIPIVLIDVPGQSFETSIQDTIKLLGQIFQEEARAEEVVSFIDKQFDIIKSKKLADKSNRPTVYYEKSGYSEIFGSTSSSTSGWGSVIAMAGADNIADPLLLESAAGKGGNNTLDPEYIIQADPDYIILSGSGTGWMDNFPGSTPRVPKFDILNRLGWDELKAVKNNNVYEIAHATSRSVFGFHGALKLAKIFYPEDFASVDPDKILDEFFNRFMLVDSDVTGWLYRAPGELY